MPSDSRRLYRTSSVGTYHVTTQTSKEGLKVGDIVFIHAGESKEEGIRTTAIQRIIILGNLINRITGTSKSVIHVEMVIGIDDNGEAIIAGLPDRNTPLRRTNLKHFLDKKKRIYNKVSVARPKSEQHGQAAAQYLENMLGQRVYYSVGSCAIAALPNRPGITSHTPAACEMMCGEVATNAYKLAIEANSSGEDCPFFSGKGRIPPGRLRYNLRLENSGFRVSNPISVRAILSGKEKFDVSNESKMLASIIKAHKRIEQKFKIKDIKRHKAIELPIRVERENLNKQISVKFKPLDDKSGYMVPSTNKLRSKIGKDKATIEDARIAKAKAVAKMINVEFTRDAEKIYFDGDVDKWANTIFYCLELNLVTRVRLLKIIGNSPIREELYQHELLRSEGFEPPLERKLPLAPR